MDTSSESSNAPAVRLRAALPADEEFLFSVYAGVRADELAVLDWNDARKDAFLRLQFAHQKADYLRRFPAADLSIIEYSGEPAGRLWVHRSPEEIRLLDIALLPPYRNLGIGSMLIGQLITEAQNHRKPLRHMVHSTNTGAIRLYTRLGFSVLQDVQMYLVMQYLPAGS